MSHAAAPEAFPSLTRFLVAVLGIVASVELLVMWLILPAFPALTSPWDGAVDAAVLTFTAGPLVWWVAIRGYRNTARDAWAAAHNREAELLEEADRRGFERRLAAGLAMCESEAQVLGVVQQGLNELIPDLIAEFAVADSSHARFRERARTAAGSGCSVASPDGCPAVRNHQTLRAVTSTGVGVCPRLRDRPEGGSAVCVPVSVLGRAAGVLHVVGVDGELPSARALEGLHAISAQAGIRVGTLRALEQIQRQASTDALTGVTNRRAMSDQLARLLQDDAPFAVAIADLDHFKGLNDTHGHLAGDRALCAFTQIARDILGNDSVGRWGGEEFLLVLPGRTGVEAEALVEQLRAKVEAYREPSVPPFTATFGVTDRASSDSADHLVKRADDALYAGKRAGRNRVLRWSTNMAASAAG